MTIPGADIAPDYLQARNSRGFLHASTTDYPEGFGERFERTMQAQGLTVTRYTLAQARDLHAAPRMGQGAPAQQPVVPQAVPAPQEPEPLPPVGTPVTVPEHGAGFVLAVLHGFEGTGALVVGTRRGQHLARPGEWTLTPEPEEAAAETAPAEPASPAPVAVVPEVPTATSGWYMPSLFDRGTP